MKRTQEEVLNWYKDYQSGKSKDYIDRLYNTNCEYHFRKYNLKSKSRSEIALRRTGRVKIINYIKNILTEQDAYILGLWLADGNVSKKKFSISLIKSDIDILIKIKNYIGPDFKIKIVKNNAVLEIVSKEIVNNFISNGIIPNKTNTSHPVPIIPEPLMRHFLRGYFDGDGTIYYDRKFLRISICSINPEILYWFQSYLLSIDINSSINKEIRQGKTLSVPGGTCSNLKDMYRIFIRRKEDIHKLYNLFYKDSTIYLDRKYTKFHNHVNTEVNNQITKG